MFVVVQIGLQLAVVIGFSPLLIGLINRVKAFFGGRQGPPAESEVGRASHGGHPKDARIGEMGPKGVEERRDAAITAARWRHGLRRW